MQRYAACAGSLARGRSTISAAPSTGRKVTRSADGSPSSWRALTSKRYTSAATPSAVTARVALTSPFWMRRAIFPHHSTNSPCRPAGPSNQLRVDDAPQCARERQSGRTISSRRARRRRMFSSTRRTRPKAPVAGQPALVVERVREPQRSIRRQARLVAGRRRIHAAIRRARENMPSLKCPSSSPQSRRRPFFRQAEDQAEDRERGKDCALLLGEGSSRGDPARSTFGDDPWLASDSTLPRSRSSAWSSACREEWFGGACGTGLGAFSEGMFSAAARRNSPHEFSVWPGTRSRLPSDGSAGRSYASTTSAGWRRPGAFRPRRRVLENKFYVDELYGC